MDDVFKSLRQATECQNEIESSKNAVFENENKRASELKELWRNAGFENQNFQNQPQCLLGVTQLTSSQKKALVEGQLAVAEYLPSNLDLEGLRAQIQEYQRIVNGAAPTHEVICVLFIAILDKSRKKLGEIIDAIVERNATVNLSRAGRFPDLRENFGLTVGMLFNKRRPTLEQIKKDAFSVWLQANPSGWDAVAEMDSSCDVEQAILRCEASAKYWLDSPIDIAPAIEALEKAIVIAKAGELRPTAEANESTAVFFELVLASLLKDSSRLRKAVAEVFAANDGVPFNDRLHEFNLNATFNIGLGWDRHPENGEPDTFCVDDALENLKRMWNSPNQHRDAVQSTTEKPAAPEVRRGECFVELDSQMPSLDTESVEWIIAREKSKNKLGMPIKTLREYRSSSKGGRTSPCKMFGVDKDGRFWRRKGTENSAVYYLASTLTKTVE